MTRYFIILFTLLLISCDVFNKNDCKGITDRPDLVIPHYLPIATFFDEYSPCWVGQIRYPYGTRITISAGINEFYMVQRYNPNFGVIEKIYWNPVTAPPYGFYLNQGENVEVFKWVYNDNQGNPCFSKSAEQSNTKISVKVRVQNGKVVENYDQEEKTPNIPPGQIGLTSSRIRFGYAGNYDFEFEANHDKKIIERDSTNNVFIKRNDKNIGNTNSARISADLIVNSKNSSTKDTIINGEYFIISNF